MTYDDGRDTEAQWHDYLVCHVSVVCKVIVRGLSSRCFVGKIRIITGKVLLSDGKHIRHPVKTE